MRSETQKENLTLWLEVFSSMNYFQEIVIVDGNKYISGAVKKENLLYKGNLAELTYYDLLELENYRFTHIKIYDFDNSYLCLFGYLNDRLKKENSYVRNIDNFNPVEVNYIETGNKILSVRKKNNLTQKEFAEKIGVTQSTLSSYENGNAAPSLDVLIAIATNFYVSTDWLLGVSKEKVI